ncbi:MAG TPA: PEP-CTERM sorting domain-containing protein [Balneolaceae bacterium]|nr:PEP-CTERM sorting domain-containing protein [Balneolaceae bacterium]
MIYMIVVEDEPGTIPLLLIVGGTAWYFITRARNRTSTD